MATVQGLELRRAILKALSDHQKRDLPTPKRQEELARDLGVDVERLDAHFTFMERSGYISFLHMPDPHGNRQRFVSITEAGERFLGESKPTEGPKLDAGPFRVVQKGEDRPMTDFAALRKYVESTEWVLDEEKPEILARLADLEKTLADERFNPARVSELKLYFEKHRWLASHISATIKKRYGL